MLELERRASVDVTHLEIPAELAVVFSKQQCKCHLHEHFHRFYFAILVYCCPLANKPVGPIFCIYKMVYFDSFIDL